MNAYWTSLSYYTFIVQQSSLLPDVKWPIPTRNWPPIEKRLDKADSKIGLCLELNTEPVSKAVGSYIQYKVRHLAQHKKYDDKTLILY
jgi:hypothetical protein